jgi:hypothetical protein
VLLFADEAHFAPVAGTAKRTRTRAERSGDAAPAPSTSTSRRAKKPTNALRGMACACAQGVGFKKAAALGYVREAMPHCNQEGARVRLQVGGESANREGRQKKNPEKTTYICASSQKKVRTCLLLFFFFF